MNDHVVRRATQIRSDRAAPAPTVVRLDEDVVRLMRDELAEVADRAVGAITEEVPSYTGPFSGVMGDRIRQAVQLALGGFLTLATREDAGTPMAPALEGAYQLGRGEARSGRSMEALQEATGARVAFITRLGDGVLPGPRTVVQEGDLVHFVVRTDAVPAVERRLSRAPESL